MVSQPDELRILPHPSAQLVTIIIVAAMVLIAIVVMAS